MTTVPAARERAVAALIRASGSLSTAATARMDAELDWFGELDAAERSWVGQIVQAGIRAFVEWYSGDSRSLATGLDVAGDVFGAAPRDLAGTISLQQTVDLVRLSIEVVEDELDRVLDPADVTDVRTAVVRYAREVAFGAAEVYARAAETRGAWDARLEALVVDAVLRAETDESLLSRASALGWSARGEVAVVLGAAPLRRTETDLFDALRRAARAADKDALCAAQGERLVVLLGGVDDPKQAAAPLVDLFGPGPVVVGPVSADLESAYVSARAAIAAYRAASGWPEAPRPVLSVELLPERALAGDGHARRYLVEEVFLPLATGRGARSALVPTLATWFDHRGSVEGTARALYVHPNTVRYRLRQVGDLTGCTPGNARDAFTLRIALVLGRQSGRVPDDQ